MMFKELIKNLGNGRRAHFTNCNNWSISLKSFIVNEQQQLRISLSLLLSRGLWLKRMYIVVYRGPKTESTIHYLCSVYCQVRFVSSLHVIKMGVLIKPKDNKGKGCYIKSKGY